MQTVSVASCKDWWKGIDALSALSIYQSSNDSAVIPSLLCLVMCVVWLSPLEKCHFIPEAEVATSADQSKEQCIGGPSFEGNEGA